MSVPAATHGLACPLCSAPTEVRETRAVRGGLRRRRVCSSATCTGRLTTYELVGVGVRRSDGRLVFVLDREAALLLEIARRLAGDVGAVDVEAAEDVHTW